MANTSIYRTITSAGSLTTWTFSAWVKRADLWDTNKVLIMNRNTAASSETKIQFNMTNEAIQFYQDYSSTVSNQVTSSYYRDTGAWYHIVVVWDTTNGTPADRFRLWVNGVRVTEFSTSSNPGSSAGSALLQTASPAILAIGKQPVGDTEYFDGEMSHVILTDGYAYDASTFGEFDATSGIWKIKTSPSVTYGTNGFFLKMEDRTNLDLDSSSNAHTFTTGGTLTATYDNPSNNFATFNPLHNTGAVMSNGNTTAQSNDANFIAGVSTLGVAAGKWYSEFKLNVEGASGESVIGVTALVRPTSAIAGQTGNFGMRNDNGTIYYTSSGSATTATSQHGNFTTSDIIGVALDMDLGRLYFSKNGGWWNGASTWGSATPSSYITLQTDIYDEFFFEGGDAAASQYASWQANFGNGYFGTTAVASTNADDAGIGSFEYDVPAGYYALCTKNIKAYGG